MSIKIKHLEEFCNGELSNDKYHIEVINTGHPFSWLAITPEDFETLREYFKNNPRKLEVKHE